MSSLTWMLIDPNAGCKKNIVASFVLAETAATRKNPPGCPDPHRRRGEAGLNQLRAFDGRFREAEQAAAVQAL